MAHFPQTPAGSYADYYPADTAEAIRHLDGLPLDGAEYLVFPTRPVGGWSITPVWERTSRRVED